MRSTNRAYLSNEEQRYTHSRLAYDVRQGLKTGQQSLHVHAYHIHMMEYYEATNALLYPNTSFGGFAESRQRQ